jgi:hypothetical protein
MARVILPSDLNKVRSVEALLDVLAGFLEGVRAYTQAPLSRVVRGKDIAIALNQLKRLQRQARHNDLLAARVEAAVVTLARPISALASPAPRYSSSSSSSLDAELSNTALCASLDSKHVALALSALAGLL